MMRTDMALYLHETILVTPQLQRAYCQSVERELVPAMHALGANPVGLWKHSSIKGDPAELVAMWQLRDWGTMRLLNETLHGPKASSSPLRTWYDKSGAWVQRRSARILRQRASAEAL